MLYRSGSIEIDARGYRLLRDGALVSVEPRVFDLIALLVAERERLVTKEELIEKVWNDYPVSQSVLSRCVNKARSAIGDDSDHQALIKTVHGRGYQWEAPVEEIADSATEATPEVAPAASARRFLQWALPLVLLTIAVATVWSTTADDPEAAIHPMTTVAVAPFQQMQGDKQHAYLQFALPEEISTELSRAATLAVRPFLPDAPTDPVKAGAVLDADNLVTGYYYIGAKGKLMITIQAIEVEQNVVLWRTRLAVPGADLFKVRSRIAQSIRTQLVPALGAESVASVGTQPAKAEAYRIYLHSLALAREPKSHEKAITMLRRATAMDPNFAPAWKELANRLRWHGAWMSGDSGAAEMREAVAAAERALSVDPNLIAAASGLVNIQRELGDLTAAYRRARALVSQHPRSAIAHYALAGVLRYGGLLHESEQHCRIVLQLDPNYYLWRSCGLTFMADGKLDQVDRYIALDPQSFWAALATQALKTRQGDVAAALEAVRRLPEGSVHRRFTEACLMGKRGHELDDLAKPFLAQWTKPYDGGNDYWGAGHQLYCDRPDDALTMLAQAIDEGFCAYPAVDRDPRWKSMHDDPRFQVLRGKAIACHQNFVAAIEPSS